MWFPNVKCSPMGLIRGGGRCEPTNFNGEGLGTAWAASGARAPRQAQPLRASVKLASSCIVTSRSSAASAGLAIALPNRVFDAIRSARFRMVKLHQRQDHVVSGSCSQRFVCDGTFQ